MAIRYTRNGAAVIEIKNTTVITYLPIFQEQVGEICTPFLICPLSSEILSQLILKYLVWLPMYIFWFFRTYNRIQPHLLIHILMDGYRTVMEAFASQINGHASVSVHSIVLVVNLPDLRLYPGFLGIVIRLPVFPVVIVSIRANIQPTQQPAKPKIFLIFFDKPISL